MDGKFLFQMTSTACSYRRKGAFTTENFLRNTALQTCGLPSLLEGLKYSFYIELYYSVFCILFFLKYAFNCSKSMSAISIEILSRISRIFFTASNVLFDFFVFAFIIQFLWVNVSLVSENQVLYLRKFQ